MKRSIVILFFLIAFSLSNAQDLPYILVSEKYISELKVKTIPEPEVEVEFLFHKVHTENLRLDNTQTEYTTNDSRFHFFKYRYSRVDNGENADKLVFEVFDTKTNSLTQLYKTDKDFKFYIDPKSRFVAFISFDTLRVVNLNTMELQYQLNEVKNVFADISFSGRHMLIDYIDFMDRHAILVVETDSWQLLTKINFFAYGWRFIQGTNKFYINSYYREDTGYKIYDRYKFSSVWDLDKIDELAAAGKLQTEYSAEEVSFIDKYTDVNRGISISPKGKYLMAGNSLYNTDGTFISQLPTPEQLGNSVSWQISNDDLYIKTFETKWRVTSNAMINDTIKTYERTLPDLKEVSNNKGLYSTSSDQNMANVASTNQELAKIIYPGNDYTGNTYELKYSDITKTIYAIERQNRKGKFPLYNLGYFTGDKDKFKEICSFDFEKVEAFFYFNKTNDKVLVRIETIKNKTTEFQLWDLVSKSIIKKISNIPYYKYFVPGNGDFEIIYFANEDLTKIYSYPKILLNHEATGDTLIEIDINTENQRKIVLNSPTICMGGISDILFNKDLAWIVTKNEAACSVAQYDINTGKKLISYQLPNALEQLKNNSDGKKIRDNAYKAKEEAERVLQANKFDAKAYKAKLKLQQKEVNSLVNQAVGEAASKKPVYETCPYCHGTGQIYNFNIAYTREVSGSWGYSSSYSNVTTTTRSNTKCTSCSGTGKSVCYKPSCYDINVGAIIQGVKNK